MTLLTEFGNTLRQLSSILEQLSRIEEEKAVAAAEKQHGLIEPLLRKEQALILSLKGVEKQRISQAEALGWGGLTSRQIEECADESQKKFLTPLFAQLQEEARRMKQMKESSDRIIRVRLRELELAAAYTAQKSDGASHSFHDKYV